MEDEECCYLAQVEEFTKSLMGLKKHHWKAEIALSAGWIHPGGRWSLLFVLRGDASSCSVSLFHTPEGLGCYFRWEGREKMFYTE